MKIFVKCFVQIAAYFLSIRLLSLRYIQTDMNQKKTLGNAILSLFAPKGREKNPYFMLWVPEVKGLMNRTKHCANAKD